MASESPAERARRLRRGMLLAIPIWATFALGGLALYTQHLVVYESVNPVAVVWVSLGLGLALCSTYVGFNMPKDEVLAPSKTRVIVYVLVAITSTVVFAAMLWVIGNRYTSHLPFPSTAHGAVTGGR